MFQFQYPENLYYLLSLPVLVALLYIAWRYRKNALAKLGDNALIMRMMPAYNAQRYWLKTSILLFALLFLIVGWANPQWGTKKQKVERQGIDVFIALDISKSMLARDVPPSRLERAKLFAQNLVTALAGNRIGLIYFAGNAYMQMPLSTDYAAAELFIKSANPALAPSQGTAIGEAIDMAVAAFDKDNKRHKALILITDGETHDEDALSKAEIAKESGLLMFTVGIGSLNGGLIPVTVQGRTDFKRDESGQPVRTRLDEVMLRDLAQKAGGSYFSLAGIRSKDIIKQLNSQVDKIEKRTFETRAFTEHESYFQYFLAISVCLILIEYSLLYGRKVENK